MKCQILKTILKFCLTIMMSLKKDGRTVVYIKAASSFKLTRGNYYTLQKRRFNILEVRLVHDHLNLSFKPLYLCKGTPTDNIRKVIEYTFKNIDELLCLCSDESVDEFVIQEREYLAIINRFISDMLVKNRGAYNYIFTGVKKPTLPELGRTINSMKVLKQKRRLYTQKI